VYIAKAKRERERERERERGGGGRGREEEEGGNKARISRFEELGGKEETREEMQRDSGKRICFRYAVTS